MAGESGRESSVMPGRRANQEAPGNVGNIGIFLTPVCFYVGYFRNRIRESELPDVTEIWQNEAIPLPPSCLKYYFVAVLLVCDIF